jgi:transposase-like protein
MSQKRRRFDQEFREGAVPILRDTGKPVARHLGINDGTLNHSYAQDRAKREASAACPDTTSPPKAQARTVVLAWWHEFYNTRRRHSWPATMTPADYEHNAAQPTNEKEAA